MAFYQEDFIKHEKKHKYIAKIKRPSGYTRYFYNENDYRNYINSMSKAEKLRSEIEGPDLTNTINRGANFQSEFHGGFKQKKYKDGITENLHNKTAAKNKATFLTNVLSAVNFTVQKVSDRGLVPVNVKGHKYIAKIQTSNGRWRYFYSQEEYDAYNKRKEYQENEPFYMNDIPRQKDPSSAEEDCKAVNPNYEKGEEYQINCSLCSVVYELRRRGYDVSADGLGVGTKAREEFSNFSKNGGENALDNVLRRLSGRDTDWSAMYFEGGSTKKASSTEDLKAKLKNEPNTRGQISFNWTGTNSGHTVAYEVDAKGNVKLLDTQVGQVYEGSQIDTYLKHVNAREYTRLDNLTVKGRVTRDVYKTNK